MKKKIIKKIQDNQNNKLLIPSTFEIDTKEYFTLIKKQVIEREKLLNDIKVYSKVISLILTAQMKIYDGNYYISMKEIQEICENEFQYLSKNWKE